MEDWVENGSVWLGGGEECLFRFGSLKCFDVNLWVSRCFSRLGVLGSE